MHESGALQIQNQKLQFEERRRVPRYPIEEMTVAFPAVVPERKYDKVSEIIKRVIDIAVSLCAIVVLLPLFVAVAIAIKLTSVGPIFFAQTRVGKGGNFFRMYKFRSMVVNADALKLALVNKNEQSGPVFKITNDPRMTSIGRFIRKFSIDELPQFWNVLKGEMSLVGPRPPVPEEVLRYRGWHARRLSVKPGLTCIWQVSGRNRIGFEDWMRMDLRYIEERSTLLDLKLLLKTVKVVVTADGAS